MRPCKRRLKETKPTFLQAHGLPGPVREVRSRRPGIQEKNVFVVCFLGNAFWVVAKSFFQSAEPVVRAGSDPQMHAGENPQHIPVSPGQAAPCPFCSAFQTGRKIAPGMLVGPISPRTWGPSRSQQVPAGPSMSPIPGSSPPAGAEPIPSQDITPPSPSSSDPTFIKLPLIRGAHLEARSPLPKSQQVLSPGTCKTSAAGAGSLHRG